MRHVKTALVLLILLSMGLGASTSVRAEDEGPELAGDDEPELKGAAKKEHAKEVKALVKYLHKEKIYAYVRRKIDELAAQGTRVGRDALMRYIATNKNHERIDYTLKALIKIKGKKTVEFICGKDALRSRQFLVQHSSAEALETLKDKRSTDALLEVMTAKRTKIKVVSACACALARVAPKDKRVVDALFKYSYHKKDTISAYVIRALGYLKTQKAMERIADALLNDTNTRVRQYAAEGLGNTGMKEALPILREAMQLEKAFTVRESIMGAIRILEGR